MSAANQRRENPHAKASASDPAPPVLFLSGWGTTDRAWNAVRGEWPGVDCRGLSWADVLRETMSVERILDASPKPWCLVGWSLGGLLALRAALAHPTKVDALVLVAATARMTRDGDYPGVDARAIRAMRARLGRDTQRLLFDFAGLCAAPDGGETTRHVFLDQAREFSLDELAAGLDALASLDLRAELHHIAAPTLWIHGELDGVIPVESARAAAARMPDARLEVLEHRGHALPWTVPGELAALMRGFVA